jgi:hypothetical protein
MAQTIRYESPSSRGRSAIDVKTWAPRELVLDKSVIDAAGDVDRGCDIA